MSPTQDVQRATPDLPPALGHFGGTAADHLNVNVNDEISAVRLSLATREAIHLNLRGIRFVTNGAVIALDPSDCRITQSSFRESDSNKDPTKLLMLQSIHTDKEVHPWWQIEFKNGLLVDSIQVYNRIDGWGARSRSLAIELKGSRDEPWRPFHSCGGEDDLGALDDLITEIVPQLGATSVFTPHGASRKYVIQLVVSVLRSRVVSLNSQQWNSLISLVATSRGAQLSADELYLLASYLLYQKKLKPRTSTGIRSFSLLLNSRSRLIALQREFLAISKHIGIKSQFIARHGIRDEGLLVSESKTNLTHICQVILQMQRFGYTSFLGYGTLLGAVREKSFLRHDDDVDLIWSTRANSKNGVIRENADLVSRLRAAGFLVHLIPNFLNVHVECPATGAVVDLFPAWTEKDRTFLHMEKMIIRSIDADILFPPSLVEIDDHLFPAPRDSSAFLNERYGNGWTESDPFFEWQWPLVD